jgi:RimJ/RimL family protein N-acetyltransferase
MNTGVSDRFRPDGRLLVRPAAEWTARAAREAVKIAKRRGAPALAHVDERDSVQHDVLTAVGFADSRRQAVVAVSVENALAALAGATLPPGVDARSAADVDEDRLRLLDDELRQDMPGTPGWRSTPDEFRDQTFADPAFDPRTYLVAVDRGSGEYLGLVRIWMNPGGPRLGAVGVRRAYRRRRIASALIANTLEAVRTTGATEVTMEYDLANVASRTLAERLGARRLGTRIELVYEPATEPSGG